MNAGSDQNLGNCYGGATATTLSGSNPGVLCGQGGLWTFVSGPSTPTISSPTSASTGVGNLIQGTYVFRWTVSGPCASGTDLVSIVVPAAVGPGSSVGITNPTQVFCDERTETVLYGTVPQFANEIVQWVQTGGPAVNIESPTDPVTVISGMNPNAGPYTFTYTITNTITGCTGTATANLSYSPQLMIDALESFIQLPCQQVSAEIAFSESGVGLTEWRLISAPAGISTPTAYSPTGSSPLVLPIFVQTGTYIIELRRTSSNGSFCNAVTDQVAVMSSALATLANAGTDQLLACNIFETDLAGNNPTVGGGVGVGTWTQVTVQILLPL